MEKKILEVVYVKDGAISYTKEKKMFVAEASSVDGFRQRTPMVFDLKVEASGNVKRFYGKEVKTDRDGDVYEWTYKTNDGFTFALLND